MSRLFTFGCSFTGYKWPTWADILGENEKYNVYQNWGQVGAGNKFILISLIECIQRNCICKDDTVAIMWSSAGREDRYIKGKWYTPGSIYNSNYPEEYIKNFTDPTGFYLDTVNYIQAAKNLLDNIGCKYYFFSLVQLSNIDDSVAVWKKLPWLTDTNTKIETQLNNLYKKTLELIQPSFYEIVFNNNWNSRNDKILPSDVAIQKNIFEKVYNQNKGPSWPPFEDYFHNRNLQNVNQSIINEIDHNFNFLQWKNNIKTVRGDSHPTPLEHLEYLQKLDLFKFSQKQIDFVNHWEYVVTTHEEFKYAPKSKKFKRF